MEWPTLDQSDVPLLNRLAVPRAALSLVLGGEAASVSIFAADRPAPPGFAIPFALGASHGLVHLPHALLERLAERAGLAGSPASEASGPRALLLEWMLLEVVRRIEAWSGTALRILPHDPSGDALAHALAGTVSFADGMNAAIRLDLPRDLAERLAVGLEAQSAAPGVGLDAVPVSLGVAVAHQQLNLRELRSLRPGDVVMIEEAKPTLHVGRTLRAGLEPVADGYRMISALAAPQPAAQEHMVMENGPGESESVETVPIGLAFEVGRLELPLAELRQLGPGSIVPLERREDEIVDILANGRRIGRGTLVRIGDGLGLRVLTLASHG